MRFHELVILLFGLSVNLAAANATAASGDEFPMRARYPDVDIITTADLAKQYNGVVIVDVRTKYEYDTLHIKDAINIPLSTTFGDKALV